MIIAIIELVLVGAFMYGIMREKTLDTVRYRRLKELTLSDIVLLILLSIVFFKVLFNL